MFNVPEAYELIRTEDLKEVHSVGYVLRHKKTNAHVVLMENDDDNKVFYIGFRTTPTDSTGVAHIIEHTVLCGSEKYPLKDPFVELVKGSLNTFLNAMTYPDKTVYPVASTNDKDFANLMDVYMDAVLHPNIYQYPEIFKQEGWHYELEDADSELKLNGVVYNEMKGAFSNPDDVLSRQVLNSLFPDTTYGFESGGDPKVIPELTRENYLAFHQRYYHPSNSYIFLYGDMDFEERLTYLDQAYLSSYDAIDPKTEIARQESFAAPVEVHSQYSISEEADPKGESYLSMNFAIGTSLEDDLVGAFEILDYALLSKPGAPLQKEILKRGLAKDVFGGFDSGTYQPVFSITAKGTDPEKAAEFEATIREVLENEVKKGIDTEALIASLNSNEFRFREADFGGYPKGLIYGLDLLDTWLYDDDKPFMNLYAIDVIERLRAKIGTGWYEELVQKYLLDNTHCSMVTVEAVPGLTTKEDEELQAELAKTKASFTAEEIETIVRETKELRDYQSEETSEEDLAKIPLLERSDLRREVRPSHGKLRSEGMVDIFHSDVETNGITYLNLIFRNIRLSVKDLPTVSFLFHVIGMVDTDRYSYIELPDQVNSRLGGFNISPRLLAHEDFTAELSIDARGKMLPGRQRDFLEIFDQVVFRSSLEDKERISEILQQEISHSQALFQSAGHQVAALRAQSHFMEAQAVKEALSGVTYFDYLKKFEANFDEELEIFRKKAVTLLMMIFRPENLFLAVTGREEIYQETLMQAPIIMATLAAGVQKLSQDSMKVLGVDHPEELSTKELFERVSVLEKVTGDAISELYPENIKKEALKTPAQVQYVCRAGDFRKAGGEYAGPMQILKVILGYDYFWMNIRVKGGAYGCMSNFDRSGGMRFVTYRDPNLTESIQIFDETPKYIEEFQPDERTMTKYIIGTMSSVDTPLTPAQKGVLYQDMYFANKTDEKRQETRNQILDATAEDIRALAPLVKKTLEQGYLVVIGNEGKIEENKELFEEVRTLL